MPNKRKSKWPQRGVHRVTTFGGLTRSQLMGRVRSRGNKTTEIRMIEILRRHHLSGWRRNYPLLGLPDFVWPKQKLVLFVDGCFWHGHDCRNLKPGSNAEAWKKKIERNKLRDRTVSRVLRQNGWLVVRVWECKLKRSPQLVTKAIKQSLRQS